MRPVQILFLLLLSSLLGACSPHPGTGIWSAVQDNEYGISKLAVNYDGKAEFNTTKPDNISWRCFWGATAKQEISMTCTPSNDPEQEHSYALTVNAQGNAVLSRGSSVVGQFIRQADPMVSK